MTQRSSEGVTPDRLNFRSLNFSLLLGITKLEGTSNILVNKALFA
jgi:hypothetical protein